MFLKQDSHSKPPAKHQEKNLPDAHGGKPHDTEKGLFGRNSLFVSSLEVKLVTSTVPDKGACLRNQV